MRKLSLRERSQHMPWAATGDASADLPGWVQRAIARGASHASRTLPADALLGEDLAQATRHAFLQCLDALPGGACRAWSFLPRPTDHDGDVLERYMRFNAGRTSAYRSRPERVTVIPAGTCVGHAGTRLVVHALHIPGPLQAVENPRQRPAWLYSERFGPVPPAFTRGMLAGGMLLASGTAAVVGERSMHLDDLEAQFQESLRNLQALADACGASGAWRSMQIYARDAHAAVLVEQLAHHAFGAGLERVLVAPLCRAELLVELEGVADVEG